MAGPTFSVSAVPPDTFKASSILAGLLSETLSEAAHQLSPSGSAPALASEALALRSAASALMWLQLAATAASALWPPPPALLSPGALAGAGTAAGALSVARTAAAARGMDATKGGAVLGAGPCAGDRCVICRPPCSLRSHTPSLPSLHRCTTVVGHTAQIVAEPARYKPSGGQPGEEGARQSRGAHC